MLKVDGELEALRMLTDRREALTRRRVQSVCRLQALLADLLPGQGKRDLTTGQAKAMLATVRPRHIAGKTRRRIAAEELAELVAVEATGVSAQCLAWFPMPRPSACLLPRCTSGSVGCRGRLSGQAGSHQISQSSRVCTGRVAYN